MTTLADKLVEAGARAMTPYAWDDAFWRAPRGGDRHQNAVKEIARSNTRAVLLAVLPMVAEEIARNAILAAVAMDPEESHYLVRQKEIEASADRTKSIFASLLSDLKREG